MAISTRITVFLRDPAVRSPTGLQETKVTRIMAHMGAHGESAVETEDGIMFEWITEDDGIRTTFVPWDNVAKVDKTDCVCARCAGPV